MNVIFVNYHDFDSPSGLHIFHLANALAKQGVHCAVYNNGNADSVTRYGRPKFRSYDQKTSPRHMLTDTGFAQGETVIHCWTPRESARLKAESLAAAFAAPIIVHMEDNEEAITNTRLKRLTARGQVLREIAWKQGGPMHTISHPERSVAFMAAAQGYTCIIEDLLDFKPAGVPGHVFWPSCEPEVFDIPPVSTAEEKQRWGIDPENYVVFYPGNMHHNNYEEIVHLFSAVAVLRGKGLPVKIIRFGNNLPGIDEGVYIPLGLQEAVVDLTETITPARIPEVMRAADFLVQPGEDNAFNHYRFPCKLPLFMASGRPVIMPRSNLGKYLIHGENCLLLQNEQSSPEEIASLLLLLINDPELARSIGDKGRAFARERFSWANSARGLTEFYQHVLAGA